jgi:hypothetical protein
MIFYQMVFVSVPYIKQYAQIHVAPVGLLANNTNGLCVRPRALSVSLSLTAKQRRLSSEQVLVGRDVFQAGVVPCVFPI